MVSGNGKSGCQFVTAVAFQQRREGGQRSKEVKAAIAAGAGLAVFAVQANQESRAAVLLCQPAGHDAHHTLMPAFIRKNDSFRGRALGDHGNGFPVNLGLHGLPLTVQLTQSLGQFSGPLRVFRQKQLHCQMDISHSSGSVDSGRQHITDGGGTERLRLASDLFHQRSDTGATGGAQLL